MDQARFAQEIIGADGHRYDRHAALASLDDGLQGIGVVGKDVHAHGRFAADSAEPAWGIFNFSLALP